MVFIHDLGGAVEEKLGAGHERTRMAYLVGLLKLPMS